MRLHHGIAFGALVGWGVSCAQVVDIPDRHTAPNVTCTAGSCGCVAGFGDCDLDLANGCEAVLATAQKSCGACGNRCDNGTCSAGVCACSAGFADCDGNPTNGCEVDVRSASSACGACGHDCLGGECAAGVCGPVLIGAESGGFGVTGGPVRAGDYLYMSDVNYPASGGQQSRIVRMPIAGGALEPVADLADRNVYFFAGDEVGLAFLSDQGLSTYDLATATLATLDPKPFDVSAELAIVPPDIYIAEPPSQVFRRPRVGTATATFVSNDLKTGIDFPIRSFGGAPHWLSMQLGVDTVDATGTVVGFAPAAGKDVVGVMGDATHFYLLLSSGVVERHDVVSGTVDTAAFSAGSYPWFVNASNAADVAVWQEAADLVIWEGTEKRTLVPELPLIGGGTPLILPDRVLYFQPEGIYRIAR